MNQQRTKKTSVIVFFSVLVGLHFFCGIIVTLVIGFGNGNTVKMQEYLMEKDSVWMDNTERFVLTFSKEEDCFWMEDTKSRQIIKMHFSAPSCVCLSKFDENKPSNYSDECLAYAGWYYDRETDTFILDGIPSLVDDSPINDENQSTIVFSRIQQGNSTH